MVSYGTVRSDEGDTAHYEAQWTIDHPEFGAGILVRMLDKDGVPVALAVRVWFEQGKARCVIEDADRGVWLNFDDERHARLQLANVVARGVRKRAMNAVRAVADIDGNVNHFFLRGCEASVAADFQSSQNRHGH